MDEKMQLGVLQRLSFVSPPLSHLDEEDGYKKIWMETEMCEYPSLLSLSLSLSHLFPPLFAHCTQFFCLQSCVCRQRSSFFFGLFFFCFFLFGFCLQKFSLIPSSHLGASSSGRIFQILYNKELCQDFAFACLCLFVSWGVFFFFCGVCWRCRR